MIFKVYKNTQVAAPTINNAAELLEEYRQYSGKLYLGLSDLYRFLSTPSDERNKFLSTRNVDRQFVNNDYLIQIFE